MAEKLTPQQQMAVSNRGGKLLVSAAAGSGKTKVLVDRLLSYLTDIADPANIDEFLIITYTKAAASELRGKIAEKLSAYIALNPENKHIQRQMERLYLTKISTVHSFCSDILREYAYKLDIPGDFRVAEEGECRQLQDRVLNNILENAYFSRLENASVQAFFDTQGPSRNDSILSEIILQVYNSARCHKSPEQWLETCTKASQVEDLEDASQTVWGAYLIHNLHGQLEEHAAAMEQAMVLAQNTDGMEKAAALLADTVSQIRTLRSFTRWDDIVIHREINYGRISYSKNADAQIKEQIAAVRDACKKGLAKALRPFSDLSEQIFVDMAGCAQATQGLVELVDTFSTEYDKAKKARRILDFGDLEHKALDLLLGKKRTGSTAAAKELGKRFREIMVDEYQDSNQVQDAIFETLTQERQNCFMVGDVKQSIYQFRLADPQIFLDKYHSYKDAWDANSGDARKVLLSSNFRSSGAVIEAVNHVFGCCMSSKVGGLEYGAEEMLREGIPHIAENEPEIELHAIDVENDSYAEEAAYTAQRISELLDGSHTVRESDYFRPIRPEDIVILLRSPGSVGQEFCHALERRGIPCTMGSGGNLLETEEVGLLYALLQVIDNPLQDIPLVTVLSSRIFLFTADELAAIRSFNRKGSFMDALKASRERKSIRFLELVSDLRMKARLSTIPQLIEYIFSKTSMDSIFRATNDTGERISNLQAFCRLAASFEQMAGNDLSQFITYIHLLAEKGMVTSEGKSAVGAVTIMSIHKSKGLEFPVVFLCALARSFNQESLRDQVLCHKDLGLGLTCVDRDQRVRYPSLAKKAIALKIQEESVSEELRILYVAMTRARDRLIMTYAPRNLSNALSQTALRMDFSPPQLMNQEAACPGDWIIYSALHRTEAGALFSLGTKPNASKVQEQPWLICVERNIDQGQGSAAVEDQQPKHIPESMIHEMSQTLSYSYPHFNATKLPSKQTATQLKGRDKDQEASEYTLSQKDFDAAFRMPDFKGSRLSGAAFGNTIHSIMQYIDLKKCMDSAGISSELDRLVSQGTITKNEADTVDTQMLLSFFNSPLGYRMIHSEHVLREFKFSVLMDANYFVKGLEDEKILIQGVVDCAIIEDDGIIVLDFKTDRVNDDTVQEAADKYRTQVETYAKALQRIYQKKVKEVYLYFFKIQKFIKM